MFRRPGPVGWYCMYSQPSWISGTSYFDVFKSIYSTNSDTLYWTPRFGKKNCHWVTHRVLFQVCEHQRCDSSLGYLLCHLFLLLTFQFYIIWLTTAMVSVDISCISIDGEILSTNFLPHHLVVATRLNGLHTTWEESFYVCDLDFISCRPSKI